MLIYIARKKGFDALNATPETSALCKVPFLKKSRKTGQNCNFGKNCNFLAVFQAFSKNGTLQRAEVYCVAFSASKPFY